MASGYAFLRQKDWLPFEDNHLIDSTLEGLTYSQISTNLSQGSRPKTEEQCRLRIRQLKTDSEIPPQAWEDTVLDLPPHPLTINGNYTRTLLPYEWDELALYVDLRHGLYTSYIFRPEVSVAYLRACIKDIEDFKSAKPEAFDRVVERIHRETDMRRRKAETMWHQQRAQPAGSLG